jgi:hypothetical protein
VVKSSTKVVGVDRVHVQAGVIALDIAAEPGRESSPGRVMAALGRCW